MSISMENHLLSQIVTWKSIDEDCDGFIQVDSAIFKRDFGPWKKGHHVISLALSYEDSEIVEYNRKGDRILSCGILMIPEIVIEN